MCLKMKYAEEKLDFLIRSGHFISQPLIEKFVDAFSNSDFTHSFTKKPTSRFSMTFQVPIAVFTRILSGYSELPVSATAAAPSLIVGLLPYGLDITVDRTLYPFNGLSSHCSRH